MGMPSSFDLLDVVQQMEDAHARRRQITPFTARHADFDLTAAYTVSRLIHEKRCRDGAVAVGRKIGFTNPAMWAQYDVAGPVWAHVYDHTVARTSSPRTTCRIGHLVEPKIEPEIVLHFHAAPPATTDVREILACVDWVAHGFELVQSHYPGWKFHAPDTVADSALHGSLLIGEPRPIERLGPDPIGALESFTLDLHCNGELRESGRGSNVLGSPLKAIAHLIGVLAAQPDARPLQAGELVTTGTITAAWPILVGQSWRTEIRGIDLPGLAIDLVD